MLVQQIKVGMMENFCYLLACEKTGQAAALDPGDEHELLLDEIQDKGLDLRYILCTHFHFDHTQAAASLREETGAILAMHQEDIAYYRDQVDLALHDGDTISIGEEVQVRVIHTPGHSPGGVCFYTQGRLFTGDTLFVGDSGRTDLPYSHRPSLGASIRRIMELPEDTVVLPGHDYGSSPTSTLRQEMRQNVNAREYGFYRP